MSSSAHRALRSARDLLLAHATDQPAAGAAFTWPRPAELNWALDWFDVVGTGRSATALWLLEADGSERRISYDDLVTRSNQVANWLRGHGVRRGDRVLLMLANQADLWETLLAVMKLGAVVIPASTLLGPAQLRDRVERGSVRHVVARSADTASFADVPGDYTRIAVGGAPAGWLDYADSATAEGAFVPDGPTPAGDPLLLYFTSGTTALPKLVEHSHLSYPVGHLSTMYWIGLRPGDVHLNISSPGWAKHAWSSVFAPWLAEATVLVDNHPRFDARRLLEVLRRCEVSTFCAPPTVWRMLLQAELGDRPPALREAVAAGEPLNPEVIAQVRAAWGLTVRDGYGQTETTAQVGNAPGQPLRPGSMGRPLPGYRVVLLDPVSGAPADEGEICLPLDDRPVGLMTGYRGTDDGPTAARGGHYHTGDVASRDADGYLTYVGRADDVFKASDYRISPFELESALLEHEAVAEAAVVPAPDRVRLAVPKAYVVLAEGWAADRQTALAVLRHARRRLAPYQRVRRLEFAELPKTISGKIRRVELRAREAELHAEGTPAPGEWREEDLPELAE